VSAPVREGNRLLDSGISALAPMIWGSTYIVTSELLPPDRPFLAAAVRALPAGLILLAIGRMLPRGDWWWRALVLGTLNIGGFFVLLFVSAYRLPGGVAALVGSVQPMLVLFIAASLLGDRIRLIHVVTCLFGSAGVALLVLKATASLDVIGVLAALGGALFMAFGVVLTKRWGRPKGVSVLTLTAWQLTVGGLVLVPFVFAFEGLPSSINGTNVTGYLYLIVFGSVVGYTVWFRGFERLPAVAISFLGQISPIVATILGYLFLSQTLSLLQIVGAVTILGAILTAQLTPVRRRPVTELPRKDDAPPAISKAA
jgi:probable blue pigment (indigoidine) exporter